MNASMDNRSQLLLIAGVCVVGIVCVVGLSPRVDDAEPTPDPGLLRKERPRSVEEPASVGPIFSDGSRPVSYSQNMQSGPGVAIINSSGGYNNDSIEVAVPGPSGTVQFVKGSDKRAVEYLASIREVKEGVVFDKGPLNVDVGTVPRAGTNRGGVARRVKVDVLK